MVAILQMTFLNVFSSMKIEISIKISPKFVPKDPSENK